MNERIVLRKLVEISRKTYSISEHLRSINCDDTLFFSIFGDIVDTIYNLLGESGSELCESITHLALTSDLITDEQRVDILLHHYEKNRAFT